MNLKALLLAAALAGVATLSPPLSAQSMPTTPGNQQIDFSTQLFLFFQWDLASANKQDPIDVNTIDFVFDDGDAPQSGAIDALLQDP